MSNIEVQVRETFLDHLSTNEHVSQAIVDGLRAALSCDKLPKQEQLVQLFVTGSGDALA